MAESTSASLRSISLTTGTQLLLGLLWIWFGVAKLVNLSQFEEVLTDHGVLPLSIVRFAALLPLIEVLLGCFVLALGSTKSGGHPAHTFSGDDHGFQRLFAVGTGGADPDRRVRVRGCDHS